MSMQKECITNKIVFKKWKRTIYSIDKKLQRNLRYYFKIIN